MDSYGLILCNANIVTMNEHQPQAQALAMRDERIVAVGTWQDVAAYADRAEVVDLAGRTVLPGFIDTHAHFLETVLSRAALDASRCRDPSTLQDAISQVVAETPPGASIYGVRIPTDFLDATKEHESVIDLLDAVAPSNPVFIVGVTGHYSVANSRALEALALCDDLPDVTQKNAAGFPGGVLTGEAHRVAWSRFSDSFEGGLDFVEFINAGITDAHSVGLTTVHALEWASHKSRERILSAFMAAMPNLPLRFVLYLQTMDVDEVVALGLPRIGGCILLDGDFFPHTAALTEPYVDEPACFGTLYHTQEEVDAFVLKAHEAGLQVAMHAIGDAAIEQALNAYEAALVAHPRADHRHRIEHGEAIRADQIQRAQRLGVVLAIQPPFNHCWPHSVLYPLLGERRSWRVDPVQTLLRAGLLVAGGSDSPVTPLRPLIGVHAAVNHSNPAERTSVYQALQLYTLEAARIAFEERDKGSLEIGRLGDLVVMAENPFEADPRCIKDIDVDMTILGGRIVYQR